MLSGVSVFSKNSIVRTFFSSKSSKASRLRPFRFCPLLFLTVTLKLTKSSVLVVVFWEYVETAMKVTTRVADLNRFSLATPNLMRIILVYSARRTWPTRSVSFFFCSAMRPSIGTRDGVHDRPVTFTVSILTDGIDPATSFSVRWRGSACSGSRSGADTRSPTPPHTHAGGGCAAARTTP